jgi:hypothetical protein
LKFLTFIENYNSILTHQRETQGGQSKHLIAGLAKLKEAEETVDKLSTAATQKKQLLIVKQAEADQALLNINDAMEQKALRK